MTADPNHNIASDVVRSYWQLRRTQLGDAPPGVRAELSDSWLPPATTVSASQVAGLHEQIPARLPVAYMAFLTCAHAEDGFIELSDLIIPTPTPTPSAGLDPVKRYLLASEMWGLGYLQFATNPYGDPVCLDFEGADDRGDYPVVIIEHDPMRLQDWTSPDLVGARTKQLAPSFPALMAVLAQEIARGTA